MPSKLSDRFKNIGPIKKPSEEQKKVYNKLVSTLKFRDIRVERMSADSALIIDTDAELDISYKHFFQYVVLNDDELWVRASFRLRARSKKSEDDPYKASVQFLLKYDFGSIVKENRPQLTEVEEAVLEAYVAVHGPAHYWPYAREFFHTMASRSGFPPIVLPVFIPPSLRPK
jgi:preprotein translocase subunit SecB